MSNEFRCARCGVHLTSLAKWCPSCKVFLCSACTSKRPCPAGIHATRKPSGLWLFPALMALALAFLSVVGFIIESEDAQRAAIPVTTIESLDPGKMAKISGTIQSTRQVVIDLQGSGDYEHYYLVPFNVTDETGSVFINIDLIYGTSNRRVIQRGLHDDDWWSGDPISVIGDVRTFPNGSVYMVARYIARTPESFQASSFLLPAVLIGTVVCVSAVVPSYFMVIRRRKLHRNNSRVYPYRVTDWDACGNCGELKKPGVRECPECGWPGTWSSSKVASLPALELGTRFSDLALDQRVGSIFFGIIFPLVAVIATAWFLTIPGFIWGTLCLAVPIFGVVSAAVFIPRYFFRKRILLSNERIELSKPFGKLSIPAKEIDMMLNVHKGGKQIHVFFSRGGRVIGFGPGVSHEDFERGRGWIRDFSQATGIRFWENVSVQEMIRIIGRKESKNHSEPWQSS